MFRTRLDNVGYEPHSEYDAFCFAYKSTQRYTITNDFPRLRRKNIDDSIGNVKYTILLNGISQFLEDWKWMYMNIAKYCMRIYR